MITFIKVQAASILGSLADYLITIILVEIFQAISAVAVYSLFSAGTGSFTRTKVKRVIRLLNSSFFLQEIF
jgi:hypothetical protein